MKEGRRMFNVEITNEELDQDWSDLNLTKGTGIAVGNPSENQTLIFWLQSFDRRVAEFRVMDIKGKKERQVGLLHLSSRKDYRIQGTRVFISWDPSYYRDESRIVQVGGGLTLHYNTPPNVDLLKVYPKTKI